jgi:glycosyltransferase involved in cell wall biosynthesis
MKPKVSVVIPCYNEEENLKRGVLDQVEEYLRKQDYPSEVIISDDESTDNSIKLAEKFKEYNPRFKLLKNKHGGKPFALRSGLKKARGEIILFTDMDQSTLIDQLAKLLPFFKKDFDVVFGSRGTVRKNAPLIRKIMAKAFLTFRRLVILPDITDTQCGFKALKRKAGLAIFRKMQVFRQTGEAKGWRVGAWDVEMLFVAEKLGYKTKEVTVAWEDRDVAGGKKKNFLKESKEMLFEMLRVRFNDWRGVYG